MNDLPELLKRHLPDGWSGRQVAREADRRGLKLSPATANNYLNGRGGRPSEDVLAAFSAVLAIPMSQLRAAAGLPQGEGDTYTPPMEASRLNRRQRLAVDELIRSIVTAQEVGNASQESWQEARGTSKQSAPSIADPLTDEERDRIITEHMRAQGVDVPDRIDPATKHRALRAVSEGNGTTTGDRHDGDGGRR